MKTQLSTTTIALLSFEGTVDQITSGQEWADWNAQMMDECLNGPSDEKAEWETMGLVLFRAFCDQSPDGVDLPLMQWKTLTPARRMKYAEAAKIVIQTFAGELED